MNRGPFTPSAHVYDLFHGHLDYAASAALIESIVRARNPDAESLLDVACGTGLHLVEWQRSFDHVEGTDVDPAMLDVARPRLPDVSLHQADFTDFDVGRRFDAVTCMFSSIGYAHTPELLDAAVGCMANHLAPGGVLVVEPWLQPHVIRPPFVRVHTVQTDQTVIARTNIFRYDEKGGTSDMEMAYLVTTQDGTEHLTERHLMGVYPPGRYVEAFERAGLDAEFLHDAPTQLERGLVVGVGP